jgi:hypothetical protein
MNVEINFFKLNQTFLKNQSLKEDVETDRNS